MLETVLSAFCIPIVLTTAFARSVSWNLFGDTSGEARTLSAFMPARFAASLYLLRRRFLITLPDCSDTSIIALSDSFVPNTVAATPLLAITELTVASALAVARALFVAYLAPSAFRLGRFKSTSIFRLILFTTPFKLAATGVGSILSR